MAIDVQATFKKKLASDFRQYKILGACHPQFKFRSGVHDGYESTD
ncbi:MAG: hypothetical protein DCF21_08040 [Leptolyngbya sp.]|nr:MAG: hypothetical protein DCF21_08040 [Leptolyngbya sp.]